MIRQILQYPNDALRNRAIEVTEFDESIKQLAADLKETAAAFRAEGLASTQIGEAPRMFVIKDFGTDDYIVCVNPHLVDFSAQDLNSAEGCLSFPGVQETITRSDSIAVSYQTETGEVVETAFVGVNAVAFQHELDHLNGVLFIDYMGKLQQRMALKRQAKVKRKRKRQYEQFEKMLKIRHA